MLSFYMGLLDFLQTCQFTERRFVDKTICGQDSSQTRQFADLPNRGQDVLRTSGTIRVKTA